jgi:hypothetical protein
MTFSWDRLRIPVQEDLEDIEYINPAEAYRRQAVAINMASPLYAELEQVDAQLHKYDRIEKEVRRVILSRNINALKGTQTRTNEMIDAFVLEAAGDYEMANGTRKDIRLFLLKLRRKVSTLDARRDQLERRLVGFQ